MIPPFDHSSVIPPFVGADPTHPANMSPYRAQIDELVATFATSPERSAILRGLLSYRSALIGLGVTQGFQWIDGSFAEDIETSENRPPNDIDVVTFLFRPASHRDPHAWNALLQANLSLFTPKQAKLNYKCDAYIVDMDEPPETVVDNTSYWFGLFSHKRVTALWKGIVQVPLADRDSNALSIIEARFPI
tara:strand:- start:3476 stop:4045 length:570 start_codon:yes stop_codon:yes gene_type:complete